MSDGAKDTKTIANEKKGTELKKRLTKHRL